MHGLSWELLCEPNFMYFCIKSSIGTQGGWLAVKALLTSSLPHSPTPVVYSNERSKAVVPMLVLCCVFCEAICCMSYLVLFCSCVFQSF